MTLKKLTVLIIIITSLKTLKTSNTEKNKKWKTEIQKEVRCFCGKKIQGHSKKSNTTKNLEESDIETIIRNLKQRYNEIIKKNKYFPKIQNFTKGLFSASESPKSTETSLFHSFRANYDFFKIFIYFTKSKNNIKLIFSLKPHKFDSFAIVTDKFDFFSQTKGNFYSYLFPSFEDMQNFTKMTSGFYEKIVSLSHLQNFENELCINFFIFLNKVTSAWVKENKKLEDKREIFKIDNLVFEKKKFLQNVIYKDFKEMIFDMSKKNGICLKGEVFSYLSLVYPEDVFGKRDLVEIEKKDPDFVFKKKKILGFDGVVGKGNLGLKKKIANGNFLERNKQNLNKINLNKKVIEMKKQIELEKKQNKFNPNEKLIKKNKIKKKKNFKLVLKSKNDLKNKNDFIKNEIQEDSKIIENQSLEENSELEMDISEANSDFANISKSFTMSNNSFSNEDLFMNNFSKRNSSKNLSEDFSNDFENFSNINSSEMFSETNRNQFSNEDFQISKNHFQINKSLDYIKEENLKNKSLDLNSILKNEIPKLDLKNEKIQDITKNIILNNENLENDLNIDLPNSNKKINENILNTKKENTPNKKSPKKTSIKKNNSKQEK